jgi:hypothetical protein
MRTAATAPAARQPSSACADKACAFRVPAIKFHEPVISYAIEPKSRGDEQ